MNPPPARDCVEKAMAEQDITPTLQRIKRLHENLVVGLGVGIGLILVLYFFTFAAVVDSPRVGLMWFQAISSVVLVGILLALKRVAFALVRLWLGRRSGYRAAFDGLTAKDLEAVSLGDD